METAELSRKECGKLLLSPDFICYKRTAAAQQIHAGSVCWNKIRMTKEKDHKPEDEEESEQEVRDLPPKKDVKGGSSKEKERPSGQTGEVDFMQAYD